MAGWVVALGTIGLVAIGEIDRRRREKRVSNEDVSQEISDAKAEMADQLKPMAELLTKHEMYHRQHVASQTSIAIEQSRLAQQIGDHEKACTEHRGRIEEMFREIRNRLVELNK